MSKKADWRRTRRRKKWRFDRRVRDALRVLRGKAEARVIIDDEVGPFEYDPRMDETYDNPYESQWPSDWTGDPG